MGQLDIRTQAIKCDAFPELADVAARLCPDILSAPLSEERDIVIFPGFCDVHVHFREPGFSYKESIASGTAAAAAGGYTDVCTMPNLNPVPDCLENLEIQLDLIEREANIGVRPYGAITVGERGERIADIEELAPYVAAFSDDGRGVQDRSMMKEAMQRVRAAKKILAAHCEDETLLGGGYIHDGAYAKEYGHAGICSKSEWAQVERDIELADLTKCPYHVCHISCKESVELIRQAKADGIDVTCETAPHYLIFCDLDLKEDGRFKMNPPIRGKKDREALLEGVADGTIDMIATDHAPHSKEEKARGLDGSLFGVVGLETAFAAVYTYLVKTKLISMEKAIELFSENPRRRFEIPLGEAFSVWDMGSEYIVDASDFLSKGKATPFDGLRLFGRCLCTARDGKVVQSS